jgi:hypothetical protein
VADPTAEAAATVCARCGAPATRRDELARCVGCGDVVCDRRKCSRPHHENLATHVEGRACAGCQRRVDIVPRPGAGRGAGSAAGVEAVERAHYYLQEAAIDLEERLRQLSLELADRISAMVEIRLEDVASRAGKASQEAITELEAAANRWVGVAADKLGQALETALARGLERGLARERLRGLGWTMIAGALVVALLSAATATAITLVLR